MERRGREIEWKGGRERGREGDREGGREGKCDIEEGEERKEVWR